jgi:hypothetical protein
MSERNEINRFEGIPAIPADSEIKPAAGDPAATAPKAERLAPGTPAAKPGAESPAPKSEAPKPEVIANFTDSRSPPPSGKVLTLFSAPPPSSDTGARRNRFAMLAASVALAAAFGALLGTMGAPGLSRPVTPDTAVAEQVGIMHAKAIDALERLERRLDPTNEVTGSVTAPPQAAAVPRPPQPVPPPVLHDWVLRDVDRGVAWIKGGRVGTIEVEAGDTVPGLGRIEAIKKQDGRWVVVTSKGLITSPR